MALKMKPFHIYDLSQWKKAKITGEMIFPLGTTYAKTYKGACKTFRDNHLGDFVVVSNSSEDIVTLFPI